MTAQQCFRKLVKLYRNQPAPERLRNRITYLEAWVASLKKDPQRLKVAYREAARKYA